MTKGRLFIITGPSGCGKGTLIKELLKDSDIYYSVSATTRPMRPEDINGVTYHFITREEFEERIRKNEMLEYTEYCGNYYGTPLKELEAEREKGRDVLVEIEVEGAANVKRLRPDAVSIFIMPPSIEELNRRLHKRGTEQEEVIAKRLAAAAQELKLAKDFDYIIKNDALEDAIAELKAVVLSEQIKNRKQERASRF